MPIVSNSTNQLTQLLLERARSLALDLNFLTADERGDVDLTGSTITLVMKQPIRLGTATVLTKVATLTSPTTGDARLDLQALDLDLDPGIYPYSITYVDAAAFSATVVKGEAQILANTDPRVDNVYDTTALSVALRADTIKVMVNHLRPPDISIGSVTVAPFGNEPSAGFRGAYPHAILDLVLPRGATGVAGPQGERGPRGFQGLRGVDGIEGPKGDTGNPGPQGPIGFTGAKGDQGDQGIQGIQGIKGDTGDVGPTGPPGGSDAATATYILDDATPSLTRSALDSLYALPARLGAEETMAPDLDFALDAGWYGAPYDGLNTPAPGYSFNVFVVNWPGNSYTTQIAYDVQYGTSWMRQCDAGTWGAWRRSDPEYLRDRANHTGTQSADTLVDGATNGAFLLSERAKLAGVAAGATANSSDAYLVARANHTGTQAAATITGLAAVATSGAKADVGLSNVNNTADSAKPVSTAQQAALDLKRNAPAAVRVSSTGTLALTGTQTIDGVACVAGNRVLVRHQGVYGGNGYDNGVWVVAAGAWTRAADADTAAELAGARFIVTEGTKFTGTVFRSTFSSTDTLGTTGLAFVAENGADFGNIFEFPYQTSRSGGASYLDTDSRIPRVWSGAAWIVAKGVQTYGAAPAYPATGELWIDSTAKRLKYYDGAGWVEAWNPPHLKLATANNSAACNAGTNLQLGAVAEDTHAGWSAGAANYVVPIAGVYRILAQAKFSGSPAGNHSFALLKNGTIVFWTPNISNPGFGGPQLFYEVRCAAGDTIALRTQSNFTIQADGASVVNTFETIDFVRP